jgi:hypothetical protein
MHPNLLFHLFLTVIMINYGTYNFAGFLDGDFFNAAGTTLAFINIVFFSGCWMQ